MHLPEGRSRDWTVASKLRSRDYVLEDEVDPEATTRLSIRKARTHPWMHESKEDLEQLWERVVLGGEVVGLDSKA